MVFTTMADSEREELENLIEDWNASRLDMFTISKPDANLDFSGNMRFYFQEPGAKDRKVSTKVIRVSSSDTTDEVMKVLVSKFHPDLKMLTMPNYSLYEVHETGAEAHKLELDQRPLYVQLYWQQADRDGRFLLKSEEDQMTQKLFEDEESAIDPEKRNSKQRQSKRKSKKKQKDTDENPKNLAADIYQDKPASSFTRTKSNPEAVMKIQRKKKLEDRLKKLQNPETSGGGGGPLRIFAESLQPENPYKTILCASNDTTETVLKDALEKYEVPPEEMDQYCLTMVTIAPGSHSDPESSSGIRERIVPDKDCPAGIAAAWPESKGELRFYLKKKENMPKTRVKKPRGRPGPTLGESSPPPSKETTFDVGPEHSPTEKEPSSPAVHVVDAARDLPANLEFKESGEDAFFAVVISEVNGSAVNFKLAPTFTLYMCCRYRLSPKFRPDFPQNKRHEKVEMTANKVATMMWHTVKENNGMAGHLAFWMANSSEFLHFLKQDVELCSMTEESQKVLAHTTQLAFRSLVQCIKAELQSCLPAFLDPSKESDVDEHGPNGDGKFDQMDGYQSTQRSFNVKQFDAHGQPLRGDHWLGKRKKASRPVVGDVLYTLKAAMSLLRRCRVNPALTIQLFSQVFHFINMWLFNRIVLEPQLRLCTRSWGVRLRERLEKLQAWAESQGLELAAECHLARVSQAALLLQIPKQDSTVISSHCYKLNSVQLRQLLELYQPERDEPPVSRELIEKAVSVAESTADEIARSEGQHVGLEEDLDLNLPFLLPDDGYFSEKTRGVPPGLKEFLDPLITPGLCRLTIQPKASGLWTVHFKTPSALDSSPPEVIKISINKGNKGMGVSIVAAKGVNQEHFGIYVKEVIAGGPASQDGRLQPGDQIIDVNGESLVGIQQESAVKILTKADSIVNMTIAKQAVYKHGLVELLSNVAPTQKPEPPNRAQENKNLSPPTQKKEIPRAPPRYSRPGQDPPQRSPPLNTSVRSETDQKHINLEQKGKPVPPPKRRNPYDRGPHEPAEQPPIQSKTVVQYKSDDLHSGRKPVVKAGVPLPYASPQEIQKRQMEMQQRKAEDQGKDNFERERMARELEREEAERLKREDHVRRERERVEKENLERMKIERENQERQRIERENQERQRIERENQERQRIEEERLRREKEEMERQKRDEIERKRKEEWEKKERERIEREESERRRQEERKKQEQEKLDRERREREEREKRLQHDNEELNKMAREQQELEKLLEEKRRANERIRELQRKLQEEDEEAARMQREINDRLRRDQGEQPRPFEETPKLARPSGGGGTQVHYVTNKGNENKKSGSINSDDSRRLVRAPTPAEERNIPPNDYSRRPPLPNEVSRGNFGDEKKSEASRSNRQDYIKRGPAIPDENRGAAPLDYSNHPASEGNPGNVVSGKRPVIQAAKDDSFDMDPAEVERQFQQRLAQETGNDSVDGGMVQVIRVPVQQDNWGSRGNARDAEDRPRARVDWQREEEERNRKQQQLRRQQDEQLVIDFQQKEFLRQPPPGAVSEQEHQNQGDWDREKELQRQHEEDDRLREARANQLRNRNIKQPESDEDIRDPSTNGRTRRVKFASVRTEIIQPSPDAALAKPGVKFVHDGKVEDSDDEEEFPRPPPPVDEEDALPPPPSQDQADYYQRPPPPPKPQGLVSNGGSNPPHYRDNEHMARARARVSEDGYATYPSRQQPHNNNYPVPMPRGGVSTDFGKSPSPDQAKLPFNDKMKVFNDNTPPKRQTMSKWEQQWMNGDPL